MCDWIIIFFFLKHVTCTTKARWIIPCAYLRIASDATDQLTQMTWLWCVTYTIWNKIGRCVQWVGPVKVNTQIAWCAARDQAVNYARTEVGGQYKRSLRHFSSIASCSYAKVRRELMLKDTLCHNCTKYLKYIPLYLLKYVSLYLCTYDSNKRTPVCRRYIVAKWGLSPYKYAALAV